MTRGIRKLNTNGWWRPIGTIFAVSLVAISVSCTHWREAYFDEGIDHLTQMDIRKKLGKPHIVKQSLLEPETTWIYRYTLTESELDPLGMKSVSKGVSEMGNAAASLIGKGGQNGTSREAVYCFKYLLTFDEEQVLRAWKREPC
ncbi:MAG: hypothetical protein D6690_15250 [Nitrospirae bacterium]|nr:MAG: hypothetical protein D6690_15250 [Nitrospirota bacterium]